jgi:hypothetical protein
MPPSTTEGSKREERLAADAAVVEVHGGYQPALAFAFERENQDKPVCVAGILWRYYPGGTS